MPSQLVGARVGSNVTLKCKVEASPKAINYWMTGDPSDMLLNG